MTRRAAELRAVAIRFMSHADLVFAGDLILDVPGPDHWLGGIAPLLTMLNSCAAGITVVNIDNGFGAAVAASRITHQESRHTT